MCIFAGKEDNPNLIWIRQHHFLCWSYNSNSPFICNYSPRKKFSVINENYRNSNLGLTVSICKYWKRKNNHGNRNYRWLARRSTQILASGRKHFVCCNAKCMGTQLFYLPYTLQGASYALFKVSITFSRQDRGNNSKILVVL